MAKELYFKAACGTWISLLPFLLWAAPPVIIYLSVDLVKSAGGVLFILAIWFVIGATLMVMRSLYLARYRLTLGIDRQTRRLIVCERRLRSRECRVDAGMVSSVKLVLPVATAGRAHVEIDLQGGREPLTLGWELGREGNGRVFSLLQRLWKMGRDESNHYLLLRSPALDDPSVTAGKTGP